MSFRTNDANLVLLPIEISSPPFTLLVPADLHDAHREASHALNTISDIQQILEHYDWEGRPIPMYESPGGLMVPGFVPFPKAATVRRLAEIWLQNSPYGYMYAPSYVALDRVMSELSVACGQIVSMGHIPARNYHELSVHALRKRLGVIGLGCWNAPVDEKMLAENLLSVREQLKSLPPVDVGDFSRQIEREVELAAARRMDDASRNASPAMNAIPNAAEQPAHADEFERACPPSGDDPLRKQRRKRPAAEKHAQWRVWKGEGLSYAAIAQRHFDVTGQELTWHAVYAALKRQRSSEGL